MTYNANFQITIDKLSSLDENLSTKLQITAYLHGIKAIYSDFTVAQKSLARTKILKLPIIMAELKDERRQAKAVELTAFPILSKKNMKKRQN